VIRHAWQRHRLRWPRLRGRIAVRPVPLGTSRAFSGLSAGFWWVSVASVVSLMGDSLRNLALVVFVYERTAGSAYAIAGLGVLGTVAGALGSLIAGPVVDRRSRRQVMIYSDLLRAALSAAMLVAAEYKAVTVLYLAVPIAAAAGGVYGPARSALLATQLSDDTRQRGNTIMVGLLQASMVVGSGLGLIGYSRFGAAAFFGLDCLSYVLSALGTVPVRERLSHMNPLARVNLRNDLIDGVRYVTAHRVVPWLAAVMLAVYVCGGINDNAMVFLVSKSLHRPPIDIAWLSIANGVAQSIASVALLGFSRLAGPSVLTLGACMMAAGGLVIFGSPALGGVIAGVMITSIGNAPLKVGLSSIQQMQVVNEYFGRVASLLNVLGTCAFVLATLLSATVVSHFGARVAVAISAGALVTAAGVSFKISAIARPGVVRS
jgi:hypothetical protein